MLHRMNNCARRLAALGVAVSISGTASAQDLPVAPGSTSPSSSQPDTRDDGRGQYPQGLANSFVTLNVGSINYALSLGFALPFLLAGMGLAGMVHTARNLARMAISVGRAEPIFAGETAQFRLYLDARAGFDRPSSERIWRP